MRVLGFLGCVALLGVGCASSNEGNNGDVDAAVGGVDSGADAANGACTRDEDCVDDGVFCNGGYQCVGQRCIASAVPGCGDGVACTMDMCDPIADKCKNVPDNTACPSMFSCVPIEGCQPGIRCEMDAECDNGVFCDGTESCIAHVCQPSAARTCGDMNVCTMDVCNEAMKRCENPPIDYSMSTDLMNCGMCGRVCMAAPHAQARCNMGTPSTCGIQCDAGYVDLDAAAPGCECMIDNAALPDRPDALFRDSNCDGIDGDITRSIFVAPAPRGSDSNPGTMAMPVATIARGLTLATAQRKDVLVAEGTYFETVVMVNGVSMFGGYRVGATPTAFWTRAATYQSEIDSSDTTAVRAQSLTLETRLELFTIRSSDATATGASSYGIRILSSSGPILVRQNTVFAGRGANGGNGVSPGGTAGGGSNGIQGGQGCSGCGSGGGGGAGGGSACGRNGGDGGLGGYDYTPAGNSQGDGHDGNPGAGWISSNGQASASGPGEGGDTSPVCFTNAGQGSNGIRGADGSTGGNGGAGNQFGLVLGGGYLGVAGDPGDAGTNAGGGGGGGGGGGYFGTCADDRGGGGGGGGGGGCGGARGTGGGGGGGSFAIFVVGSITTISNNTLNTSRGGTGGTGGDGQGGGRGGFGLGGGGGPDDGGDGGPGGDGGNGGSGGSGAGGTGGPSVGVFSSSSTVTQSANTGTIAPGGTGGTGGNNGISTAPRGTTGASQATATF